MTLRAVVYIRVSTDDQADDGTGLDTQEIECRRLAERLQMAVVAVESDPGVSGTLYPRPGIERALQWLADGEADCLIAYNASRLGRKVVIGGAIWERVDDSRARLFLCDMGEVTHKNEAMFFMGCTFAQHNWRELLDNMRSGRIRRAEQGQQASRTMPPYGYYIVKRADVQVGNYPPEAAGKYVIVEDQAKHVRELFRQYAAGASLNEVCRWLTEAGIPTPRNGDYWRKSTVKRILQSPTYKGEASYGRYECRQTETTPEGKRKHTVRLRIDGPLVKITCPALIDAATWEVCQERLRSNRTEKSGNPARKHRLTGLLKCPSCGRGMRGESKRSRRLNGNVAINQYYHCPDQRASRNPGKLVCNPTMYEAGKMESIVDFAIREVVRRPELVHAAIDAYSRQSGEPGYSEEEAARLHRELKALQEQEKATVTAQIAGIQQGANPALYAELFAGIARKREALQERIATQETRKAQQWQPLPLTVAERVQEAIEAVYTTLSAEEGELEPGEIHNWIALIIKSITPEGEGLHIEFRPVHSLDTVACVSSLRPPNATIKIMPVTKPPTCAR